MPVVERLTREDRSGVPVYVGDDGAIKTRPRFLASEYPVGTLVLHRRGAATTRWRVTRKNRGRGPRMWWKDNITCPRWEEWISFIPAHFRPGAVLEVIEPAKGQPVQRLFPWEK